jgi:hypothetical protein
MKQRFAAALLATLLMWLWSSPSRAVFLDENRSVQITGKVFSQASLRVEDSDSDGISCYPFGTNCEGFTFPNTKAGQLIQHRNLLDMELFQDVAKSIGSDFTALDQLAYRVRAKWYYDGVWDYGPKGYSDTKTALTANSVPALAELLREGLVENQRKLSTQKNPLWNAYIDIARSSMKFRIGRQDLSWGESDGFRLLDQIEPLDNRFGFPLVEDLDDRRIPLWMVRPTWTIGSMGPFFNLTVDGYWVPGGIDNEVSPGAPTGNPFAAGAPPGPSIVHRPNKNAGNSRGGARLLGTVGDVTFSIAHYVTFNDIPSVRAKASGIYVNPIGPPDALPNFLYFAPDAVFLADYYQQQITGASATFALPFDPYTIVRTEMAHFWDERVFEPARSVDAAVARCAAQLPTGTGPCAQPGLGDLPTKNILRWMIGLDRNVWIRWLNPENTFYLSAQYFHTNIFNYDKAISNPLPSSTNLITIADVPVAPGVTVPMKASSFHWVPRKNDEISFTYLANTLLWHGTIQPQVFGMYDLRGVNAIVPSISYQYGTNLFFIVKYAVTFGTYANLGFFRDRDEVLFRVQYNLS